MLQMHYFSVWTLSKLHMKAMSSIWYRLLVNCNESKVNITFQYHELILTIDKFFDSCSCPFEITSFQFNVFNFAE